MSLRKRNGHWHYRFQHTGLEYTGNTNLAATSQNKTDAIAIEVAALQALRQGKTPVSSMAKSIFRDGVAKYRNGRRCITAQSSALTRESGPVSPAHWSSLTNFPVSAIDAARCDDYKVWRATEHEVKDVTIRHDLHALSKFFQYAVRHHLASSNPISEIDIPSDAESQRMHVLSFHEEMEYFRRARRNANLHDLALLIINQGFRPEEVVALRKEDINFDTGKIFVSSGKTPAARRYADMTADSRDVLHARMAGSSPWIFPSTVKLGSHIGKVNSTHDRILREAEEEGFNLNFVLYDLRHTFATRAAEAGVDLKTLADILGHNSLRCVHKYVHPSSEHKKRAMQLVERSVKEAKRKMLQGADQAA